MTLPNFLIIGAARCGTTSLHYYLAEHPDVCMSSIKEPNFFLFAQTSAGPKPHIADQRLITKSVAERTRYERLFARATAAVGEASPLYLYARETPARIKELVPDARLIAIVREPIDRAWSHFRYVHADLSANAVETFARGVETEIGKRYEPYETGTHFLRLSAYAEQLERYRAVFPAEQLLVLRYDDLINHGGQTLARICAFLGIDDSFRFDTSVQYNPSSGETSGIARLDRLARPMYPYLKKTLPAGVSGRLARSRAKLRAAVRSNNDVRLPSNLVARLDDYFAPDLEWLRREVGITFPARTR